MNVKKDGNKNILLVYVMEGISRLEIKTLMNYINS